MPFLGEAFRRQENRDAGRWWGRFDHAYRYGCVMEPTFLHIHRDDWRGECPRCLQESVPLELELPEPPDDPVWEKFQGYVRQQVEAQVKMQEQLVRDELLRTWLLSPGGPGIVKAILYQLGSEQGERLYLEIQEEAKKYIVEDTETGRGIARAERSQG